MSSATLYIVSTPIGNLKDITLRALEVLKSCDIIAVEDTRHSLKLLNHYGISKPLISYWAQKEKTRSDEIINKLLLGQSVALISDAGTPGISDPGSVLIAKAIANGINVVSIPGACAAISALSISGLNSSEFYFVGFLPPKKSQRLTKLKTLQSLRCTLIFYEAPHRILESITDMYEVFKDRQCVVCKELTKLHEEVRRGTLGELKDLLQKSVIAGEYVVLVQGSQDSNIKPDDVLHELQSLLRQGMSRKDACRKLAEDYGLSKRELYELSLKSQAKDL